MYDAASTQRERVLAGFDEQREAILKAVAEQREAALAPIKKVHARQASGAADRRANPLLQTAATGRQSIAADIVATLKALVAEEVRTQLVLLLEAATHRNGIIKEEETTR